MTQYEKCLDDAAKELGFEDWRYVGSMEDVEQVTQRAAELLSMWFAEWIDRDYIQDKEEEDGLWVDPSNAVEVYTTSDLFNEFNNELEKPKP